MPSRKTSQRKKFEKKAMNFFRRHYFGLGKNKKEAKEKLRSQATFFRHIETAAFIQEKIGAKNLVDITQEMALDYLLLRATKVCNKTLQNERRVLERIIFLHEPEKRLVINVDLPPREWVNRAYTHEQIYQIMSKQSEANQLATALCFTAGLRAQELLTLQRFDEAFASKERQWRKDLFIGSEGKKYIVKGKGGLYRVVMIPHILAERLEQHRLETPREIKDRKCTIINRYDITGGKKFTDAFSQLSKRTLGWSHGAHGLRYAYAQERLNRSIPNRNYDEKLEIISQELGHFRKQITPHYLHKGTCS
ncbi:integrase domain-containing protein [Vibrio parahaemolyticus]|nr:integrase domain-containing protein [Vibrio parahaemolyticus]